ncbi:MAG: UDP-glucose/GDP-mannose dehydrogenase family protein [Fimbriimonadaceae bacterium]
MRVAIVGTGYVGLVTGVVLASLGNRVVCVDKDPKKLAMLRAGQSPLFEPGLQELITRTIAEGLLTFSDCIAEATKASEVVFIAVGTPSAADGSPDMSAVLEVAREIGCAIDKPTLVVNKSTMPVGSGEVVENVIRQAGAPEGLFHVVSNPEFLREGSAVQDTLHPDRIVIGASSPEAAAMLAELYAPLDSVVQITDRNTAEVIKYASNAFLATKISYINAISRICELCGADVGEVAKGMGADVRIGPQFLQAGLGWGGSCFPKDVQGLIHTSRKLGYDFKLLEAVVEINDTQTTHFLERLGRALGGFSGKRIAIWGLAFKPNTDDIRDAKSILILNHLLEKGATVVAFDPVAIEPMQKLFPDIEYVRTPFEAVDGADALVLVTEWSEFRQIDLAEAASRMKGKVLADGRRIYNKALVEKAGLRYLTIGGPSVDIAG